MCVIICLKPGEMIDWDEFFNACHNNEHGFGMVTRKNSKSRKKNALDELDLIKMFNEEGNDPKEIYDIIKQNRRYQRYIHLRNTTVGKTSQDNVQPFLVFDDKESGKQIYFMHNGTLSEFKGSAVQTYSHAHGCYQPVSDDQEESDTFRFAEEVLKPSLVSSFSQEIGLGDYSTSLFTDFLTQRWKSNGGFNRGLLVSNFLPELYLNDSDWKMLKKAVDQEQKEVEIKVSNDKYFDKLVRGTLYEANKKAEEERKKKEEEERKQKTRAEADRVFDKATRGQPTVARDVLIDNRREVSDIRAPGFTAYENCISFLPDLARIWEDPDIWNHDALNFHYLSNLTMDEWIKFIQKEEKKTGKPTETASLLMTIVQVAADEIKKSIELQEKLAKYEDKVEKASKQIAQLKKKLNHQDAQVG